MEERRHTRAPRSDGLQNRGRILDHAEALVAQEGTSIGLHRVARGLPFGVATIYRHFPTHDDLIVAIYQRLSDRIDDIGERILQVDSARGRVDAFIDSTIQFALDYPYAHAVALHVQRHSPQEVRPSKWAPTIAAAVEEAKREGLLRADIEVADVAMAASMVGRLSDVIPPIRDAVIPRMRALVIDAIAPDGTARSPLPLQSISTEDLAEVTHHRTGLSPASKPREEVEHADHTG